MNGRILDGLKIVSGGQTGADRAALDFAIEHGIPHGGWCPAGRNAEDGTIDLRYKLQETPSGDYVQRTEWNVRDSGGTVIFTIADRLQGGSGETARLAREYGQPCLHLAAQRPGVDNAAILERFVEQHHIKVLNVAGPRGSEEPTIAKFVTTTLRTALTGKMSRKRALCALVLDDDALLRQMCALILPGLRVFGAETNQEALQLAEQHKFDFVVTDYAHLGPGNGLQFIEEMRKAHPSVPVIMASGMEDQSFRLRALELGACAYITKPFPVKTFLAAVDDALSPSRT